MRRGRRMDDEGLHVRDVRKQRENLEVIDEAERGFLPALDLEGKDARAAVREIPLVERVVGVIGQRRMVDLLDLRMVLQELHDLLRVLRVPLEAKGQRLRALQEQKRCERRDGRALVTQQNRARIGHKGRRACRIDERHAMIAGVRVRDQRELSARSPVKLAGVDDHAAKCRAMAADELRRRVDNDVRAVLDGADEIGRAEGVVNDDGKRMLVRNFCDRVDVGNIAVGIAEGLEVNGLRVGLNGCFDLRKIVCVHKRRRHAEGFECMGEQIIRAAVDGLLADDVVTLLGERFDRICNCRRAGGDRKRRYAALERRNALFKDVLCGIREPAVDVARVTKGKAIRRVLRVVEYIGSRRINRDGTGIGGGVGLFLTDVELQSFKMIVGHNNSPSLNRCFTFCFCGRFSGLVTFARCGSSRGAALQRWIS